MTVPAPGRELAGHNRISTQALTAVAQTAAARVFAVPPGLVRVSWRDDGGTLALSLALPVSAPPLGSVVHDPAVLDRLGGGLLDRARAAKARILARVEEITGATLSRVDIRITGLYTVEAPRVR
ncbi:hypothetical protein [Specibacter cremeus]|uniref:hypothetical protein n=1 Tax=Specibacter cremeus TaxID=1629051 RepID=UPI000F78F709|nr:hypothetical protein [Specibacter cremeus]